jgi:DNA polymerase III subunit alpha
VLDLHRHDEYSTFDGFGKALDLARLAKKKGLTALGIANHGNMNGVVEHWKACKQEGLIPVLGVEAYFQPKFNKKNPKKDSFHLCLFAENLEGYANLNRIMSVANEEQKYYKPLVDFPLLEKYSEGVICTSGCIASFISQMIVKKNKEILFKAVEKFIDIFGKDNFYIELQPYKLDERTPEEKNLQERVNVQLVKIAKKYGLKMILTSDSHYGSEHDYDTYCKMHEIKGSGEFNETYRERYMPDEDDLVERFVEIHEKDFKDAEKIARMAIKGLNDIENKVDPDILGKLEMVLPKFSDNSKQLLLENVKKGIKDKLKASKITDKKKIKEYIARCKEEYDVIVHHGFEDYFLIVEDYVKYAKRRFDLVDEETAKFWKKFIKDGGYPEEPIKVGPGRGSVCNSLAAYALDITTVDSLFFDIDFKRFLRMDKYKMPDIDLDFETDRRQEVIEYIIAKYPGKSAQICAYGLYKVDNLLNDLFKVCGVNDTFEKQEIKAWVKALIVDDEFDYERAKRTPQYRRYNKEFDNIIIHFSKMYKKVRYIGTHAAGVAVVGGDLLDYTSIELRGNKKDGYMRSTAYNLNNLDEINVLKFDMLGLRTLSITKELEELTNECFSYEWLEDPEIYEYFAQGRTDGIFQFEKNTVKGMLQNMEADNINDVFAASALNRPGPLSLKMPEHYAHNKKTGEYGGEKWAAFTNETYGTIVYQEQIQAICRDIGGLSYEDADRVVKFMKSVNMTEAQIKQREKEIKDLRDRFIQGCQSKGMTKQEAHDLFEKITVYSFNKGHTVGYGLISMEQMYFKVKHPELFWYVTLKYAKPQDVWRLEAQAVKEGNVILLPHVNYGAKFSIVEIDGENALAEGLSNIKGVGPAAANAIENERLENGKFKSKEDFIKRMEGKKVNVGTIKALEEYGSLLFNRTQYFKRVKQYNSTLYMKGLNS